MADPREFGKPIAIEQTHPIVTQAWTPPYKPAALPLQKAWQNVMADANVSATDASRSGGKYGSRDPRNGDFFYKPPASSPRSNQPNLPGGSKFSSGGGAGGGGTGGAFNVFAYAGGASAGGDGMNNSNFSGVGGSRGGASNVSIMLPNGLKARPQFGTSLANFDDDDEYDERVGQMRNGMAHGGGLPGGSAGRSGGGRRKTKAQREAAREEYRKHQEELANNAGGNGYQSGGGEVDDGCVGAMGEDDEVRDMRLRFSPDARAADGTGRTAYASAVHRKRAGTMRTPPAGTGTAAGSSSAFQPPGLRTPVYDPMSNMPTPVQRFQRRQQHHLLRMLGGASPMPQAGGGGAHQLFAPHEIPSNENGGDPRRNKFDEPSAWLFGRDDSIDDVMRKHFLPSEGAPAAVATPAASTSGRQQQPQPQHNGARRNSNGAEVRTVNLRNF